MSERALQGTATQWVDTDGSPRIPGATSEIHRFDGVPQIRSALRQWWTVTTDAHRLLSLFEDDYEDLHAILDAYGLTIDALATAYEAITTADIQMVARADLVDTFDGDHTTADIAAEAVCDLDDVYPAKDGNYRMWYVHAPPIVANRCDRRRLSLQKYRLMEPVLADFRDAAQAYFFSRHDGTYHRGDQSIGDIKRRYTRTLQDRYYPQKPIEDAPRIVEHVCWRYIKTAQDEVMLANAFDGGDYSFVEDR